jgi:hypothetical protein
MKKLELLGLILILSCLKLNAQDSSKKIDKFALLMPMFGYNYWDYHSAEIDLAFGNQYLVAGGGVEVIFKDTNIISPKIFYRLPLIGYVIYSDLNLMYMTNSKYSSFAARPEICIQLGFFKVGYGYNFLFDKDSELEPNTHNFNATLTMFIPVMKGGNKGKKIQFGFGNSKGNRKRLK